MMRLIDRLDVWLIEGWRHAYRLWSLYWQLASSLLLGAVMLVPSMPGEIAALVPEGWRIAAIGLWALLGIYARLKHQKGLKP
jgi:hypothetical protein